MKRAAKYILLLVLAIQATWLIIGCSARHRPKAYVCVEKSPLKVTYIDFHKDITPETVQGLVNSAKTFPYKKMNNNKENIVIIDYDAKSAYNETVAKTMELKK